MKQLLVKLFNLQPLIDQAATQGYQNGYTKAEQAHRERENKRVMINFPLDTEVILVGNSPKANGATRATVVGFEQFKSGQVYPILRHESGEVGPTFAHIMRFDPVRWETLKKLTWWEQWNSVTSWGPAISANTAKNLEAGRPAYQNEDGSENEG